MNQLLTCTARTLPAATYQCRVAVPKAVPFTMSDHRQSLPRSPPLRSLMITVQQSNLAELLASSLPPRRLNALHLRAPPLPFQEKYNSQLGSADAANRDDAAAAATDDAPPVSMEETAMLERLARARNTRRALSLLDTHSSASLFATALMLFGMHAQPLDCERLFRGATLAGHGDDSVVWSAFICAVTMSASGAPTRGLELLEEMRSRRIAPQIAAVRAVSDRLVEQDSIDAAFALLRDASALHGIDPASPHLCAAFLRAHLAVAASDSTSTADRAAALASAAAVCVDLAQRGVLPSVKDADSIFIALCDARTPLEEIRLWLRRLHATGADCSGGAWLTALEILALDDPVQFTAETVARAQVATGAADALIELLLTDRKRSAALAAGLSAYERSRMLSAVVRRASVLRLKSSWHVVQAMFKQPHLWKEPRSGETIAQFFVTAASSGEHEWVEKMLNGSFKSLVEGGARCTVLRALAVAFANVGNVDKCVSVLNESRELEPVPRTLHAHICELLLEHNVTAAFTMYSQHSRLLGIAHHKIDWSAIISWNACRGNDTTALVNRTVLSKARYPVEVQMHGYERHPGMALVAYARICKHGAATPRTHYWAMMIGINCSYGYKIARDAADRLVASGEPLAAMHYDALLKAALASASHDAILSTLRDMHSGDITIAPDTADLVNNFAFKTRRPGLGSLRRTLALLAVF